MPNARFRGQSFFTIGTDALEEFKIEEILQGKFDDGRQRFHLAMNMIKQDFRPSSRTILSSIPEDLTNSKGSKKS